MSAWLRRLGFPLRRRRPHRHALEVMVLERRELQAVIESITTVHVHPGLLHNTPNGQFIPVAIFGDIATTRVENPAGFWFVTDEYRRVEPQGTMTLTPAGKFKGFPIEAFSFTIELQARRSTNTPDGRHYDIFVGATDSDGAGGKTVAVYVPKTFPITSSSTTSIPRPPLRHGRSR
jgi:hypothetical protein